MAGNARGERRSSEGGRDGLHGWTRRGLLSATVGAAAATGVGRTSGSGAIGSTRQEGSTYEEDFESYSTGSVPESFVLAGSTDQGVTDGTAGSGSQSYEMNGSPGGCWQALARRSIPVADSMTVGGRLRVGEGEEGCHDDSGRILFQTAASSDWSVGSRTGLLEFGVDGTITCAGTTVGEFEREEWVSFEVEYARDTEAESVTYECSIDGGDPTTVTRDEHSHEDDLSAFEIQSGDFTVYWDDLRFASGDATGTSTASRTATESGIAVGTTSDEPFGTEPPTATDAGTTTGPPDETVVRTPDPTEGGTPTGTEPLGGGETRSAAGPGDGSTGSTPTESGPAGGQTPSPGATDAAGGSSLLSAVGGVVASVGAVSAVGVLAGGYLYRRSDDEDDDAEPDETVFERAEAALEAAEAARASDDYDRAVEQYETARDRYETAQRALSPDDDRQEPVDAALADVHRNLESLRERGQVRADVRSALDEAETNLRTAVESHASGQTTVAQVRYRQARDRYDEALERCRDYDGAVFESPIELARDTAGHSAPADVDSVPSLGREPTLADAGIDSRSAFEAATDAELDALPDLQATLAACWWRESVTTVFASRADVEARRAAADEGLGDT